MATISYGLYFMDNLDIQLSPNIEAQAEREFGRKFSAILVRK